jgi:hypothetical protein
MRSICTSIVATLALAGTSFAATIHVSAGGDIQAAINGASDGDIIQLEAGEYLPVATIDTHGKAVTLRGVPGKGKDDAPTTVIDGQYWIRVLQCTTDEGAGTVFENLVITGGFSIGKSLVDGGGGMFNKSSSPTLINCTFTGNLAYAYGGGGMYNYSSNPTLIGCTFTENSTINYGGGMLNYNNSSPTLTDCTFTGNSATNGDGAGNWGGGGMYNYTSSSPTLINCTFTGNLPDTISGDFTTVSEACVPGDFDGDGDVDADDHTAMGAALGICPGDTNGDGVVNIEDLLNMLGSWGACP